MGAAGNYGESFLVRGLIDGDQYRQRYLLHFPPPSFHHGWVAGGWRRLEEVTILLITLAGGEGGATPTITIPTTGH